MTKLYVMLLLALMVSVTTSHARGVAVARAPLQKAKESALEEYTTNTGMNAPMMMNDQEILHTTREQMTLGEAW